MPVTDSALREDSFNVDPLIKGTIVPYEERFVAGL